MYLVQLTDSVIDKDGIPQFRPIFICTPIKTVSPASPNSDALSSSAGRIEEKIAK